MISWQEKSGELENIRFLINRNITLDELKKEGSWEEKRGELLKKRGKVLLNMKNITTSLAVKKSGLSSILIEF